ncbi:MAG: Ig-like domain-containing protein, partial [Candidatus Rokuibacteriota bacterium]
MARRVMFQLALHRTIALLGALAVGLCLLAPRVAHAPDPPIQALAPFEVIAEDVRAPRYLAVDVDGHLLVSEANPGQILRIAPSRTVQLLIDRLQDPEGLLVEPTAAVVVAADRQRGPEGQGQRGVLLRRDQQTGSLAVIANDFQSPRGLAHKVDGSLLLTAQGRRGEPEERAAVYAISTAGQIALVADTFRQPQGVLADDDESVLVAAEQFERGRDRIEGSLFRIDPIGQVSALITRRLRDPFGLAQDLLGGVYLSGTSIGTPGPEQGLILKRRPDGQVITFAQGLDVPRGLALDQTGHLYGAEAGRRRLLKFTAPPAPTLDPPPPTVTNQSTLSLTGATEPGALVTGMGGASMVTTHADGAGRFSLAMPLSPNASNALMVYATARGGDGLTSAPASALVTHDDLAPGVALTSPAAGALLRGSVPVTATATDPNGLGLLTLKADSATLAVANTSPVTTPLDSTGLGDGPHIVSATARDRAGNEASASVGITSDNTSPVLAITAPAHGSAVTTRTPTLSMNYSDATTGLALSSFRATLDGADISGTFAATPTGATATVPTPLAEGPHTLTASIADRAGNLASASATFTVSTGPDFALTAVPETATTIQGLATTFTVTAVPFSNYANLVSLTASGLPTGVSAALTPPQVAPNASARLGVTVTG